MASKYITWSGIGLRFLFATILVFSSYNPHGASYYHFLKNALSSTGSFTVTLVFFGILILIGWTIFVRATVNSLGAFGFLLATAFFVSLFWVLINWGIISATSHIAISYMILIGLSGILTVGISWSHIRRRLTGQIDVDEMDHEG